MSIQENKLIVRRFYEAIDARKGEAPVDLITPNFTFHAPGAPPLDRAGFEQFARSFYDAFPDLVHTVSDQLGEGDRVASRVVAGGTHTAAFQGIPPTGRPASTDAISIFRIAEGRVAEIWVELDALGLLQQIGAIPEAAPAGA